MRGDGYRPPDLIPPVLRGRVLRLLEYLQLLLLVIGVILSVVFVWKMLADLVYGLLDLFR